MSTAPELAPASPTSTVKFREDRVTSIARFRPPRSSSTQWAREQWPDLDGFTSVLGPSASQADVFAAVGKSIVDEVIAGKNACLLAYGSTGSGKTHSLVGSGGGIGSSGDDAGLLPRCVNYLFDTCNAKKRAIRFRVSVTIVEIYKEQIRDLIAPDVVAARGAAAAAAASSPKLSSLEMREKNGVFFLPEANIRVCSTADAVLREIKAAFDARTTGSSHASDVSSRAHAIATISLVAETNVKGSAPALVLSRMSFVDLCGSEVLTDAFGAAQQSETKAINLSLFALRGVVSALAEKASFIPYRAPRTGPSTTHRTEHSAPDLAAVPLRLYAESCSLPFTRTLKCAASKERKRR